MQGWFKQAIRTVTLTAFLLVLLETSPLFGLSLTGNVLNDFLPEACFNDPHGINIGIPPALPDGTISGFDIEQICLIYNQQEDILYVGWKTFDQAATGLPIPFGDADGDGDPSGTSLPLAALGGTDFPDLSVAEHFAMIVDFDADPSTPPEIVAGVSFDRTAPDEFRVSEVALPHLGVDLAFLPAYYGPIVPLSQGSVLFASPSAATPHLEFTVTRFSFLPGFMSLQTADPDETVRIVFEAGGLGDAGIGEEKLDVLLPLQNFFDGDGDGLPNNSDFDQDNDGIPDVSERNLDVFDADGNCRLSAAEAANSGLDVDQDGDLDIEDDPSPTDTDGDGTPDLLDADTDNDGLSDLSEAGLLSFDTNGDGAIFTAEFAGCLHNAELPDGDGDGVPDYRDTDTINPNAGDGAGDGVDEGSDSGEEPEGTPTGTPGGGPSIQLQGSGCSLIPSQEGRT